MRRPYRSTHSGGLWPRSHSGATTARLFRACRSASVAHPRRTVARTRASTWVESVRCRPRALSSPRLLQRSSNRSSSNPSAPPSSRRERNSQSTEASNPGSVSSSPSRYFQSMRARTASAAARSERSSRNCRTVIRASRQGAKAGCPLRGYRSAKSASWKTVPSLVAELQVGVAVGEGGVGDAGGVLGDGRDESERKGHGATSRGAGATWCKLLQYRLLPARREFASSITFDDPRA